MDLFLQVKLASSIRSNKSIVFFRNNMMEAPKTLEEIEASLITPNVSEDTLNLLYNLRYTNAHIDIRDVLRDSQRDDEN